MKPEHTKRASPINKAGRPIAEGEEDVGRFRVLTHKETGRRNKEAHEARERWLHLLANQMEISPFLRRAKRQQLRALVDFVTDGIPLGLDEHDPALFERLLKETAQLHNSGLYARVLKALAQKHHDARAGALLLGLKARQKLALDAGGSISAIEASRLLRISEAVVLRRVKRYQLLAWRDWREERLTYRLPVWQFEGRRLLPGIKRILKRFEFGDRYLNLRDDWGAMLFFLVSRHSLEGKRVLDLLRIGQVDKALQYLEDDAPVGEGV